MFSSTTGGVLAPRLTSNLEDHPLSAVRDSLFSIFAATLHIWRPFLHPQSEDAPCCSDRDPLIMVQFQKYSQISDLITKLSVVVVLHTKTEIRKHY